MGWVLCSFRTQQRRRRANACAVRIAQLRLQRRELFLLTGVVAGWTALWEERDVHGCRTPTHRRSRTHRPRAAGLGIPTLILNVPF